MIQKVKYQRDPEVFFVCQVVFLDAWVAKANKPHFFNTIMVLWPCRLRRQGRKTSISLNIFVFWDLAHQASKNPLEQFGIPLKIALPEDVLVLAPSPPRGPGEAPDEHLPMETP